MVGESFGKILHVPKHFEEDQDLPVVRVGVLVGVSSRINEVVALRWRLRTFRVWVEEDLEDWIPDCLKRAVDPVSPMAPSAASSTIDSMQVSGVGEKVEGQPLAGGGVAEESPVFNVHIPQTSAPSLHADGDVGGAEFHVETEMESSIMGGVCLESVGVGPEIAGGFKARSGPKSRGGQIEDLSWSQSCRSPISSPRESRRFLQELIGLGKGPRTLLRTKSPASVLWVLLPDLMLHWILTSELSHRTIWRAIRPLGWVGLKKLLIGIMGVLQRRN
ncbi:hypothetical protein Hdeb2414_s0003g00108711 [Helianthus debilis subsp. tardiflorus]